MRKILRALLNVVAVAGVFLTFIASLGGAAAVVGRMGIVNEDFLFLFAVPAMIVGGVALAWLFRKRVPEPPAAYLLPAGLLIFMAAVPTLVAVVNVKLDRSPSRRHSASVLYSETRDDRCRAALKEADLGIFWVTLPGGQTASRGSSVEIVTRPGFLGFTWIERVGAEPGAPTSPPPRGLPAVER